MSRRLRQLNGLSSCASLSTVGECDLTVTSLSEVCNRFSKKEAIMLRSPKSIPIVCVLILAIIVAAGLSSSVAALQCPSCTGIPNCDCTCKEIHCNRIEGGGIFCSYHSRASCSTLKLYVTGGDATKECKVDNLHTTDVYVGSGCNDPQCTGCLDLNDAKNYFEDSCTAGGLVIAGAPTFTCQTPQGG